MYFHEPLCICMSLTSHAFAWTSTLNKYMQSHTGHDLIYCTLFHIQYHSQSSESRKWKRVKESNHKINNNYLPNLSESACNHIMAKTWRCSHRHYIEPSYQTSSSPSLWPFFACDPKTRGWCRCGLLGEKRSFEMWPTSTTYMVNIIHVVLYSVNYKQVNVTWSGGIILFYIYCATRTQISGGGGGGGELCFRQLPDTTRAQWRNKTHDAYRQRNASLVYEVCEFTCNHKLYGKNQSVMNTCFRFRIANRNIKDSVWCISSKSCCVRT